MSGRALETFLAAADGRPYLPEASEVANLTRGPEPRMGMTYRSASR